jgi:hypothetical protein
VNALQEHESYEIEDDGWVVKIFIPPTLLFLELCFSVGRCKNDLSLFNELSRENYDPTELDDGADLTGMLRYFQNRNFNADGSDL